MTGPQTISRKKLKVTGVVQGVGFRPFVYRLAKVHQLAGWVCNTSTCVEIEVEGPAASLEQFIRQLSTQAPGPGPGGDGGGHGGRTPGASPALPFWKAGARRATEALIPADVSTCDPCFAEVLDPHNRRYLYPFTNCTDCGPRFTIIQKVPYDRGEHHHVGLCHVRGLPGRI